MPLRSLQLRRPSLLILCLFGLAVIASARAVQADFQNSAGGNCCPNYHEAIRPGDEIYLVSTRCLPSGCGFELPVEKMSVQRYDGELGWVESSLGEAVAGDAFDCTSFFVHGNGMNAWWAKRRGWAMYHELTRDWGAEHHVRYVIWSWPTENDSKSLAGIRRHAERADSEAYYLAWFLSQLPADEQVGIAAFSLGAHVVSGAMQLQAGGRLNGRVLDHPSTVDYRIVFFAAATSSGTFSPYCSRGDGLSRVERLVNYYNSADPVLKRFWLLEGRGSRAMGYSGASGLSSEGWSKVQQYDMARTMGREHEFNQYACNRCIMAQASETLRFGDVTEVVEPVEKEAVSL